MGNEWRVPKLFACGVGLAVWLTPAITSSQQPGAEMQPGLNNTRVKDLFETTKTVCIGRVLLDVPNESDVIYGPARLPFWIERWSGQGHRMREVVEGRLAEIERNDRPRARGALVKEDSMFGKAITGAASDQKIIFGADKAAGSLYAIYSIQRIGSDLYATRTAGYGNNYREALARINDVALLLRPRAENEIPTEPGICLDGAFLREPTIQFGEIVALGVRLRRYPDVQFSIEMMKKSRIIEEDGLEQRIAAGEEAARDAGISEWHQRAKVFRRGSRKIAAWIGYEYLGWKPPVGKASEAHEFAFFSHGEPGNKMLPTLDLQLDTGVKDNLTAGQRPSLTHDEALYVWERITATVRPRPVTMGGEQGGAGTRRSDGLP